MTIKNLQGFFLINKPLNYTSFDVIKFIRKKFNIKKVGHTCTLDPLATGLMVVGVGQALRFIEFHSGHTKEYQAEITFGKISETYDSEGPFRVVSSAKEFLKKDLEFILKKFQGEIEQIPPKYSALKIKGEKYCNLVRTGKEVDILAKKRKVTIYKNKIIDFSWPRVVLEISCSAGTYIRSIANDLGQITGCGAYLSALKRTKVDNFSLKNTKNLEDLTVTDLLPLDIGIDFPKLELTIKNIKDLQHGRQVVCFGKEESDKQYFKIYCQNKFFGIVKKTGTDLRAKKIIFER